MPIYALRCKTCHAEAQVWKRVEFRNEPVFCHECNDPMERIVSAPYVAAVMESYVSPKTGRVISDRRQQADDLARSDCMLMEPGLEKDIKRWGAETKEKAFAPVEKGVDEVVTQLVNSGKIET